jgi:hypothetical protein
MAEMLPTNFELRFKYCLLDTGQGKKRCCLKIKIKFFLTKNIFLRKTIPTLFIRHLLRLFSCSLVIVHLSGGLAAPTFALSKHIGDILARISSEKKKS